MYVFTYEDCRKWHQNVHSLTTKSSQMDTYISPNT